jgi:hypothetical protein
MQRLINTVSKIITLSGGVASLALLSACGGSNDDSGGNPIPPPAMQSYSITLKNITHSQPLAPAAVIFHDASYRAWAIGSEASVELEMLAESGNPAMLLDAASAYAAMPASDMPVAPGDSTSVALSFTAQETVLLTVASMPVNTNDAFTGVSQWDLSGLAVGDTMTLATPLYDAGTEFNSETAETVPGPAAGGEGFNAQRDDVVNFVSRHPGVVTMANGYAASALDESQRMDNPVMLIQVTRNE